LTTLGFEIATGEKPKVDHISDKVKQLIDSRDLFVGIFTRREKISRKAEWTTSLWVIDEKAYAVGKGKKLLLIKEEGVTSIGGIQGDYEFIEFRRDGLESLLVKVLGLFRLDVIGFST
jgi:hypothetical protein